MRKLAFRYRRVKEMYNTYKNNVGGEWAGERLAALVPGLPLLGLHPGPREIHLGGPLSLRSHRLCAGHCSDRVADICSLGGTLTVSPGRGHGCFSAVTLRGRRLRNKEASCPGRHSSPCLSHTPWPRAPKSVDYKSEAESFRVSLLPHPPCTEKEGGSRCAGGRRRRGWSQPAEVSQPRPSAPHPG